MASTKVATVIVNQTGGALVLKSGNQNCLTKLGTIGVGGEYKVQIDVNWTYQEFSLQAAAKAGPVKAGGLIKKVVISSDDCCDFERITLTESGGQFQVDKVARWQPSTSAVPPPDVPPIIKSWKTYFTWPKKWRFWA